MDSMIQIRSAYDDTMRHIVVSNELLDETRRGVSSSVDCRLLGGLRSSDALQHFPTRSRSDKCCTIT